VIKATLIDSMGDDLRVVNAARVSFDKESEWAEVCTCGLSESSQGWPCTHGGCNFQEVLSEKDQKLIQYLARHNHWTPFSHPQITLREDVPIFVARQRFKHMVGFTYNEVSRRYVDEDPEFYVPEVWRKRADNLKQGSLDEPVELDNYMQHWLEAYNQDALGLYKYLLMDGVAPEQARMVLPQSMMTSYYVTGSLAAFARAYKQRSDSHSQREIQDLAAQWDTLIRPLFPVSWGALVD
jgi:thymidylate synthase (FAD)